MFYFFGFVTYYQKLELTVRNRRVDFRQSNRCRVSRSRRP